VGTVPFGRDRPYVEVQQVDLAVREESGRPPGGADRADDSAILEHRNSEPVPEARGLGELPVRVLRIVEKRGDVHDDLRDDGSSEDAAAIRRHGEFSLHRLDPSRVEVGQRGQMQELTVGGHDDRLLRAAQPQHRGGHRVEDRLHVGLRAANHA